MLLFLLLFIIITLISVESRKLFLLKNALYVKQADLKRCYKVNKNSFRYAVNGMVDSSFIIILKLWGKNQYTGKTILFSEKIADCE